MTRYRWLRDDQEVVSVARKGSQHAWLRGKSGMIRTLPCPGCIANVLVDFAGVGVVVVPAGTLRNRPALQRITPENPAGLYQVKTDKGGQVL